jgi:hypothetical protein
MVIAARNDAFLPSGCSSVPRAGGIVENPVIVAIDDDPQVLRAVERDLRGHFGSAYRIIAADSGATALDVVRRLKLKRARPSRCSSPTSACRR